MYPFVFEVCPVCLSIPGFFFFFIYLENVKTCNIYAIKQKIVTISYSSMRALFLKALGIFIGMVANCFLFLDKIIRL